MLIFITFYFSSVLTSLAIIPITDKKNVALVIQKKDFDDIEIYLGARDFEGPLHESSTLLKSAIQGYLPGIKSEQAIDKHFLFDESKENYVASYSGVASLRDDKKEEFIQGIEKFID